MREKRKYEETRSNFVAENFFSEEVFKLRRSRVKHTQKKGRLTTLAKNFSIFADLSIALAEVCNIEKVKVEKLSPELLIKIAQKIGVDLSDTQNFYLQLGDKLGDFGEFLTSNSPNMINTNLEDNIYINNMSIIVGKVVFSTMSSMHDAISLALILHIIFDHPFDESCKNLGSFLLNLMGLDIEATKKVKHYLSMVKN